MKKIKGNKEEEWIPFINKFSLKERYKSFPVFNGLLAKLAPEVHRRWTLKSLVHYISKVYEVAYDLDNNGFPCLPETSDGKYIFFNTGLVDKYYDDIYCLGEVSEGRGESIIFKGFCTKQECQKILKEPEVLNSCKSVTEILQKKIYELYKKENFFFPEEIPFPEKFSKDTFKRYCDVRKKNLREYRKICKEYDEKQEKLNIYREILEEKRIDKEKKSPICAVTKYYSNKLQGISEELEEIKKGKKRLIEKIRNESKDIECKKDYSWRCFHLIIDGSDNIPMPILHYMLTNLGKRLKEIDENDTECIKFLIQYAILDIGKDDTVINICSCIYDMLKEAMSYSLKLNKQLNMIAPYYFIKEKNICFMLPLFLEHLEKPDCALIFNEEGEIKTLINMDEVYTDLRLIGRIDAYSWLSE